MNRRFYIQVYLFFALFLCRGQQIGNYIANGSFEERYSCAYNLTSVKHWTSIDSITPCANYLGYCNNNVPNNGNTVFQLPRSGDAFVASTFYNAAYHSHSRNYIKNRLRATLNAGEVYCVKFYVNIPNMTTYGNDGFGIYFGDNSIDTITHFITPLTYLTPQVKNPNGVPVVDTLGWTAVSGSFVATGTEKYAIIGIFAANGNVDTALVNPTWASSIGPFTDACIEDVSCIPVNLPAYAGPDQMCLNGDSVYIGRATDFALDPYCVWYKLPNMSTSIDTVSGLWVKPTSTSTYVVRQQLPCGSLKWDTVVINMVFEGLNEITQNSAEVKLYPNPTKDELNISVTSYTKDQFSSLQLKNSVGQVVMTVKPTLKNNIIVVPTSSLNNGIYYIVLTTQNKTLTKRFVKVE